MDSYTREARVKKMIGPGGTLTSWSPCIPVVGLEKMVIMYEDVRIL